MDLELKGKKVVVSAASRGVGRAIVERFLREGAEVSICARRRSSRDPNADAPDLVSNTLRNDGLEEALAALSQFGTVHGSVVDCADQDQVTRWVQESAERMGGIDIVVSNASALGGIPRNRRGWDLNYHVDLLSAVAMWDAAYPYFRKSDAASFVQIATISAVESHPFAGCCQSYGAMKAALINYTSQLAQEYMSEGIRANCVSPGPTYVQGGSWDFLQQTMPDYYEQNVAKHPAKRLGRPEEIADVVVFLASPRASWVTGENIVVDGGFTRHVKF
ncbi:SDR family NAD(P)-dependent oxidoreductase [Pedomonas sp. V897]|uniref:SDR family NAD(P)-dependent oxidoreductase n=1 Tax=Pedomonas sp. V897 TaxID=3446482 RepID=UPI003EDFEDBA